MGLRWKILLLLIQNNGIRRGLGQLAAAAGQRRMIFGRLQNGPVISKKTYKNRENLTFILQMFNEITGFLFFYLLILS
jgi:hypothetical protein